MTKEILFLCSANAGRSQMAQAFFNNLNNNQAFTAVSAGTDIATEVSPICLEAMQEVHIDMSDTQAYHPKKADFTKEYAKVYSLCDITCHTDLPVKINKHLNIEDPKGKSIEEVRKIRDAIKEAVLAIIKKDLI